MVSDWSSDDLANPNRDKVYGWPLDADDAKGDYQGYSLSELYLTRTPVEVVSARRWRPYKQTVDVDQTYDRMSALIRHNEDQERQRQRDFEKRVEDRAREMVEGLLAQPRPEARAIRL